MTTPDKLVSIIIPCYNQGRFLGEAIESALQQSYRHFEVIVVDDGSTDSTPDVVARHPEVLRIWQENRGVSAARNTGLRASRGRYLVFLDGDDRLLPHALEIGMKQLEKHVECAMVFGRHRRIAADGSSLSTTEYPVVEKDYYCQLLISNYIQTPSTAMFRRPVFERIKGFDPLISFAEDYDLYLRIAREFPIVGHKEIVAEYRRHGANASENRISMSKACLSVLRSQKSYVQGNRVWKEARQRGLRIYRRQWAEMFLSKGRARLRKDRESESSVADLLLLLRYTFEVGPGRLGRKLSRFLNGLWNKGDFRPSTLK